jgi:hypothetical protein
MTDNLLLGAALDYARHGWPVFPLHTPLPDGGCSCGRADCSHQGKHPRTPHGLNDATTDDSVICQWWKQWPDANIGLVAGARSGLVVLDLDVGHAVGVDGVAVAKTRFRFEPKTHYQRTGGGGLQCFFKRPDLPRVKSRSAQGAIAPGVELKADGGYVVVPPSLHKSGKRYEWVGDPELDGNLPDLPVWALNLGEERPAAVTAGTEGLKYKGERNSYLASLAGAMRRRGMIRQAIEAALLAENAGRCVPPLPEADVRGVASSISRYEPGAKAQGEALLLPDPQSVRQLLADSPELRPPVIHGLLRRGETMNVISAPKRGKSWLVTDMALSVAMGLPWLGFQTQHGAVLILDNELHGETIANRIPKVAEARGIPLENIADRVFIENLRGRLQNIFLMKDYFSALEPGRYKIIVLDAFYRFMPVDKDENDNGTMANIYNAVDTYADYLGCSFVLIHHSTKGNQSGRVVTDVGAGAGAQSRATDTHLILRPHEQDNVVVLDAAVRSWPPIQPRCLRWAFPIWTPADDLDPAMLRPDRSRKVRRKPEETTEPKPEPWTVERFVEQFVTKQPRAKQSIIASAGIAGMKRREAEGLLSLATDSGAVHRWEGPANKPQLFATEPRPEEKKP